MKKQRSKNIIYGFSSCILLVSFSLTGEGCFLAAGMVVSVMWTTDHIDGYEKSIK